MSDNLRNNELDDRTNDERLYGLKMWDTTLMTQIDIQVAEFGIEEIRRV